MVIDVGISKYYGKQTQHSHLLSSSLSPAHSISPQISTDLGLFRTEMELGGGGVQPNSRRTRVDTNYTWFVVFILILGGHLAALEIIENNDGTQSVYALYPGGKRLV